MRCLILYGLLASIWGAQAQSTTLTTSATKTKTAAPQTVTVGGYDGHSFTPGITNASVGDTIVFRFVSAGHSVVKAAFGQPCIPYETVNRGESGFFSGFFNGTDTNSANPPTWNLTINDTSPIFFYCSKLTSCLENHMVGVINPNSSWTLDAQISNIGTTDTIMLQPGEAYPTEGPTGTSTTSATASATSASAVTSTPSATSTSSHQHSGTTLSAGAIAGIAVAGAVILALASALFWFMGRHRTLKSQSNSAVGRWVDGTSTYPPSSVGGGARPPSYMPGDQLEMGKHWEGQPLYGGLQPHMQPQIQELSAIEAVELDDGERGRSRTRASQEAYRYLIPK